MPAEGNWMLKEYFMVHLTKINILIVSILLTGNKLISRDILFYISIKFRKGGKMKIGSGRELRFGRKTGLVWRYAILQVSVACATVKYMLGHNY
jgi:hypothetical protein